MEDDLRRLAETAEALERQAGELRSEIRDLTEAVRARAAAEAERARTAAEAEHARTAAERERPTEAPGDQAPTAEAADDSEARLVAYSMVLDGRPRDEVAEHLERELGFADSGPLLDDLYARTAT